MKKVIFISALAIAAAVSCTKSDIVDTKFNEQIGFTTYLGRDAQTKADVIEREDLTSVKVFGYYHGLNDWATSKSLLWENGLTLTTTSSTVTQPSGNDVRYWANETDQYSFLAYAPVTGLKEIENFDIKNPVLTYTVSNDFTNGDVLVAEPQINRTKNKFGENAQMNGNVPLQLKHKLARLTVKADVTAGVFDFRVKNVTLTGSFNTTGEITLSNPAEWDADPTADVSYTFFDESDKTTALPAGVSTITEKGYLMMIPVKATEHNATLTVEYATFDPKANQESATYTQTFEVTNDFDMGTAYAITLLFENDAKPITFDVVVDPTWGNEQEVTLE